MNFREWVLFKVPKYLLEAKKKKKVVKHTKPSDGPNPFFELAYISPKKLKELRQIFDGSKVGSTESIPIDAISRALDNPG